MKTEQYTKRERDAMTKVRMAREELVDWLRHLPEGYSAGHLDLIADRLHAAASVLHECAADRVDSEIAGVGR